MNRIASAGIIAAGEGSRFKRAGVPLHKPLIPIGGFPLIGHALRNLESLGARKAVLIFNEEEGDCVRWVKKNFTSIELHFIVKSTASSFESFWRVGRALGRGRHLISTVDAFCLPKDLKKLVRVPHPGSVVLGLTAFVDDEKPLWVRMEKKSRRIRTIGGDSGDYATAGFYSVPGSLFRKRPNADVASLRWFLKWLLESGVPVYGALLSKVVDVDTPKDVETAERLLKWHARP